MKDNSASRCSTAAVFHGPGLPLRLERFPMPALRTGEVLVRVTCCAICGSDFHTVEGRRSSPAPSILGHEAIGIVEEIAAGGAGEILDYGGRPLRPGDRVTWSMVASCGDCFFCRRDIPQKCESLFKYGHEQLTDDRGPSGGLSEYCVLRPGTAVVPLPDELPDLVACPANCATATVAAAVRIAGDLAGANVLVQGAGMLGLTATAMAHAAGAARVIVVDPDARRLAMARQFGAALTFDPTGKTNPDLLAAAVRDATAGRGVDIAMEFSGWPESVELALPLLRTGAVYVLAGAVFPSRAVAMDPQTMVRRMLRIQGIHNYTPADLVAALDFLCRHQQRFPFHTLVGATFDLTRAQDAFDFGRQHRPPRVAVVANSGRERKSSF